ncbi:glucose-6-phosphate isomerase [Patescibacteria group bacterium]|nr:glucose-6-phosphate isomerase [Patescibacteria group bacterium]
MKKPDIRFLNDAKNVLYDQKWAKKAPNLELYYMYRGIKEKNGLRYDITIIPPKMLGEEFIKTKGHEHCRKYQELYTVLQGKAIYLIQKLKNDSIQDVFAVKAKKGESVIIPSGYGHITINPSNKELKTANWTDKKCKGIYERLEKKQGACYFYTKIGWIKNKNYKKIPALRFEKPLKSIPEDLNFLKGQ